jgi:hypothetical protein
MILGIQQRSVSTTIAVASKVWNQSRRSSMILSQSTATATHVAHQCRYASGSSGIISNQWESYEMAPPDPIIGLNEAYQKDTNPNKVIVGVGAYRDDHGKPYVLPSVHIAEQRMMDQQLDMEYSGIVSTFGDVRNILEGVKCT